MTSLNTFFGKVWGYNSWGAFLAGRMSGTESELQLLREEE